MDRNVTMCSGWLEKHIIPAVALHLIKGYQFAPLFLDRLFSVGNLSFLGLMG